MARMWNLWALERAKKSDDTLKCVVQAAVTLCETSLSFETASGLCVLLLRCGPLPLRSARMRQTEAARTQEKAALKVAKTNV